MGELEVTLFCGKCRGTGQWHQYTDGLPNSPISCPQCGGDGRQTVGTIDVSSLEDSISDITDKCDDIKEKVDEIKEVVDAL